MRCGWVARRRYSRGTRQRARTKADQAAREHQITLSEWIDVFVKHCYEAGWPRTKTAEAVLGIQAQAPWMRGMLGGAWASLSTWAGLEPPELHCMSLSAPIAPVRN